MGNKISITSRRLGRIVEDSASEIYIFAGDDFKFSLVNRGARENLGYTMPEMEGLTPWDIKPEVDRDEFLAMVGPLIRNEKDRLDFETVHQRKDGSHYNVVVRLQLIRADGDDVFYAAIEDTTIRKRMEAELHSTSARLDAILSNTAMAVLMMDDQQQCVFMNLAAEQLTGYTLEEIQGRTLHDVIHHSYPDGRPFPIEECAIDRAFPENHQTQGEDVFVHKDGTFYPVGFNASPMKDENGKAVGTIIEARNITEELQARETVEAFNETLKKRVDDVIAERKTLESQLVQSQKMDAIGQLTGGIAHDFNNLLQVIGGNLQLLQKEFLPDDKKQERVQNALSGVTRGAKLAAQLLAFGRQQTLEPKPINVGQLVRGMDDMLRRVLGESVEIESVISAGLWNCLADPAQVENVILNLAINARDAMDHVGKLTIEAGNASLDDAYVNDHANLSAGQYVMLAVTDTGEGIPPDIVEKVFEPFFSTKGTGEGSGLGLSMVYGFIKQSGGHIKIYSEQGQGTTVRVYLPRTRQADAVDQSDLDTTPDVGGDELILVVEDDSAVRATTVDLLRDLGYSVVEASNADNGMAIIESGLSIDLLFTDVVMPGELRSPELARRAKERLPNLGVLFTSGYTQNAIVHAGRLDDGVELISKPFTRERLSRKIREVLDSRQILSAPVKGSPISTTSDGILQDEADQSYLILLVEDDVMISMATAEMLMSMGHEVVEVGTVADAKEKLASEVIEVMITDLGLPDGSGADLVRDTLDQHPDIAIIVASGDSAAHQLEDITSAGRLLTLNKPFAEASLKDVIDRCSMTIKNTR